MAKPWIHSLSSAKKYGGIPEDYMPIHQFLDSSKGADASNRHRVVTHNAWFISAVLERIKFPNSGPEINYTFPTIINSDGKVVSVRDIGETHLLEDFQGRFIPALSDYIQLMDYADWLEGRGVPPSYEKIAEKQKDKLFKLKD